MILAGVKLMLVGMTTVVLFLILMIFLIQLVSRLTRGATAREIEALRLERELLAASRKAKSAADIPGREADDDIAAIAAAVAAYEAERFAHS